MQAHNSKSFKMPIIVMVMLLLITCLVLFHFSECFYVKAYTSYIIGIKK